MDCNSFPGLKRTALPGGILTSAPVRGLRPMPVLRGRTLNTPKPRNSMRSPTASAFFMLAKTVSTASSALVLVMPVLWTTSLIISSLITGGSPKNRPRGRNLQMLWDFDAYCQWSFRPIKMTALRTREKHLSNQGNPLPMAIKSDRWIRKMALEHDMINPFNDRQVRDGVISYGVSSYGYDLRVADEFKIFTNVNSAIVDPKNFDQRSFIDVKGPSVLIPPNSFALARSVEYFKIPRDVLTICVGKSTYARCGIIVNVTPFEPEWEGFVTLEISNSTPLPAKIYSNEGLCQILFFQGDEPCEVSYKDKSGKYQKQSGIVLPKL